VKPISDNTMEDTNEAWQWLDCLMRGSCFLSETVDRKSSMEINIGGSNIEDDAKENIFFANGKDEDKGEVPFYDPITKKLMKDPVL